MEATGEPSGASCPRHPAARAVATCARCGVFVCASCRRFYDYQPLCDECYVRRSHGLPATRRAVWALVLAVLGVLFVVLPFGIPAVILAHGELAAIERGEAPAGGLGYARAAAVMGWLANCAFMFLLLGVGVYALGILADT